MQVKILKRLIKDKMFGKTKNTALDVQVAQMADARMGAMYMLASTEISKVSTFSNAHFFDNFVIGSEPLSDFKTAANSLLDKTNAINKLQKTKAGKKVVGAAKVVGDAASAVITKVKQAISDFFRMLMNKARSVYGELLFGVEYVADMTTWLIGEFAGNFSSFIPGWGYVQSASDIYSGRKTSRM
ncbi:hypothetical protein [Vibrio brasiliensis]|uniref:Uncharacterized protein n=1 Tax=Vibrio brasiliensis LMG 20546 TaxID=945543 RepID=E8LPD5_9VIBR|nr:hypothetical protein [Vibrio brasiliensis]EGA67597.1 hypothetical protein VIBR0546_13202 [Vibrio brasiliensis LMG 20546]